jgi:hypothetical protein
MLSHSIFQNSAMSNDAHGLAGMQFFRNTYENNALQQVQQVQQRI